MKYKYNPKSDHKTIEEAYNELSRSAFATWLRLHMLSENELKVGMTKLAKSLGYKYRGFYDVTNELRRKGYIDIEFGKSFKPSAVKLQYRCLISGFHRFITI